MRTEPLEVFYYPNDYFDFSDGKDVSETTINIWIQEMFDKLKGKTLAYPDQNEFFHVISTGNTKVLIEAYRQTIDIDKFTVYVSVCTCYKQSSSMGIKFY